MAQCPGPRDAAQHSPALPAVGSPHCPLELALPRGDSGLEERGAPGFTLASENELRRVGGWRYTPQPDSLWLLLSVRFGCLLSSKPRVALPRSGRPSSSCGSSGPRELEEHSGRGRHGLLEVMVAASHHGVHGAGDRGGCEPSPSIRPRALGGKSHRFPRSRVKPYDGW